MTRNQIGEDEECVRIEVTQADRVEDEENLLPESDAVSCDDLLQLFFQLSYENQQSATSVALHWLEATHRTGKSLLIGDFPLMSSYFRIENSGAKIVSSQSIFNTTTTRP